MRGNLYGKDAEIRRVLIEAFLVLLCFIAPIGNV